MLGKIAVSLAVILVGVAAYVATRPSHFTITRSRVVSAPPSVVYSYLNDFHRWTEWSPWEKRDPALKRDYSGVPAGVGAGYAWAGNNDVGEGRMTITESTPSRNVTLRLEFLKPFAATNTTTFDLAPSGSGTAVTWTMSGENNFLAKAFSLFMNMDALVGTDFEQGLSNLDAVTAAGARTASPM